MKCSDGMARGIDAKCRPMLGIVYDCHDRGLAAPENYLVSVKPDSLDNCKEFLSLGFTVEWAELNGVPKGL